MTNTRTTETRNPLLWWVGGAFAVLILAWAVFFVIASRHKVEEVPLQSKGAR
jgi:hypothetical protein